MAADTTTVAGRTAPTEEAVSAGAAPPGEPPKRRLVSVDVLRGVAVAGMLLVEQLPGDAATTWKWLRHAPWNGWTGADLVFPGFLFVVGMSLALSLRRGGWTAGRALRLAKRLVLLIVIGFVFNGWHQHPGGLAHLRYPGVLQRIGLVGFAAAVVVLTVRRWWLVAATAVASLAIYAFVLTHAHTACGVGPLTLTPKCSIAGEVDRHVFTAAHIYHRGTFGYDPEGLLSSLGALATVLLGWLTARALVVHGNRLRTVLGVATGAAGLLWASGHLWQSTPINKRLWTPPFAVFTAAVFAGAFAVCLVVFERGRVARAVAWPWAVLGRNALVVYVGQHLVGGSWVPDKLLARHWPGDDALLAHALVVLGAWWVVAVLLHLRRWYVTV